MNAGAEAALEDEASGGNNHRPRIREIALTGVGFYFPSAVSPSMCVPLDLSMRLRMALRRCWRAFKTRCGLRTSARSPCGVVDTQALQHVDDFLVLGKLGDGLLAGQVADPSLIERTIILAIDGDHAGSL